MIKKAREIMANTDTYYRMGFRMPVPEAFKHTKGFFSPMEIGDQGDGTYFMVCTYTASTAEEMKVISAKSKSGTMTEEDSKKLLDTMGVLLVIIAIDGGQGIKEIKEKMKMGEVSDDNFTEVGRYKDLTYYAITDRKSEEAYLKAQAPVFAEEFRELQKAWIEALKNAEYFGPQIPGADLVGKTLRFETKDIDGNPVKSDDLFAAHKVTMVNFWATWCGPCKNELEELGNIHRRLEKKNAAIIGICDDAADKADICRELIREKDLSYINILPYEGMDELSIQNFPTSLFVDNEGKVLTYPVIGVPADISEYEKVIDGLLSGTETSTDPVPAADDNKKDYRIVVKDEAGDPVAGVRIQFCDDTTCMFAKTDAEGTAAFSAEPGKYSVHMSTVPEGYELNEEEIPVTEDVQEVYILLKKA
ncbi:MAG: redoxin domain-containing protein [Lachnospiraceae bacterium]|nr:redoxin domain-containing protein [Erysipelotrichaceae bacterium]MBR3397339.1 redoxin domain-containing protein [Lachnospiraceae bacterium]